MEWMSIAFLFLHDPFPVSHCCSVPVSPAASPAASLSSFSSSGRNTWEEHYEFPPVPSEIRQPVAKALGPHDLQSLRGGGCVPRAP